MSQPSSMPAAPSALEADRGEFERFIPFDEETRLTRVRNGLMALRDLCVESRAEIVRVDQIGYLIELAVLDLDQLAIGTHGHKLARLGDQP